MGDRPLYSRPQLLRRPGPQDAFGAACAAELAASDRAEWAGMQRPQPVAEVVSIEERQRRGLGKTPAEGSVSRQNPDEEGHS